MGSVPHSMVITDDINFILSGVARVFRVNRFCFKGEELIHNQCL